MGLLAVCFWIAYLDISYGGFLLDPASVFPFLIFMAVPAVIGISNRWNLIRVLKKACIPIGILVCVINVVVAFNHSEDLGELSVRTRLTYTPLALGIILSFLLSIIEPIEEIDRSNRNGYFILAFFTVMVSFIITLECLGKLGDLNILWLDFFDTQVASTVILISAMCSIHPKMIHLNFVEKIYQSSLGIILFFPIFGAAVYVYATTTDTEQINFAISYSVRGLVHGAFLSLVAIVAGGCLRETDQESMLYDWHMVESYTFYVLIIFAPLSYIEFAEKVWN